MRIEPNTVMSAESEPAPSFKMGNRILARAGTRDAYAARLAVTPEGIRAAQKLRFEVFNLELNEGLARSFETGLDSDPFDEVCDHLIVEERRSGRVVGTYRLQTGTKAGVKLGYYSAQEFDFSPFEPMRANIVELGRACVHSDHRNLAVLSYLWRGIANYSKELGARYLIGCSSLTSQDPAEGATMYANLTRKHLAAPQWRTVPLPELACPLDKLADKHLKVPKLLGAYLSVGAKICGPPAIDREFKTIDFLTLMDLETLPMRMLDRYLG
jgi:putative hemolysin